MVAVVLGWRWGYQGDHVAICDYKLSTARAICDMVVVGLEYQGAGVMGAEGGRGAAVRHAGQTRDICRCAHQAFTKP